MYSGDVGCGDVEPAVETRGREIGDAGGEKQKEPFSASNEYLPRFDKRCIPRSELEGRRSRPSSQ